MDFVVDFTQKLELLKPVNGVVNGPKNEALQWVDTTEYYRKASIPFVRLHDTLYPNAPEVDISQVFPNFGADPDDPASYDFRKTDIYLRDVAATGAEIFYRLGEAIEHHSIKNHVFPPKDPAKWAQICLGIVRHYNEGWADGFHYGIRNWEIWEEADSPSGQLWQGTPEEYFELYAATATALKSHDPTLLVGGYASCEPYPLAFARKFLDYVGEKGLPLDFFTYDIYTNNPEDIHKKCLYIRKLLDEKGFGKVPVRIAEWNNTGFMEGYGLFQGTAAVQTEGYERRHSHMGAAYYTGAMMLMQDMPLENAAFYAFNSTSEFSVFSLFGQPYPAYYAYLAYKRLRDCPRRVTVEVAPRHQQVYALAGLNEETGEGALLISNFGGGAGEYNLALMPPQPDQAYQYEIYLIDEQRSLELVDSGLFEGALELKRHIPEYGVLQLLLK